MQGKIFSSRKKAVSFADGLRRDGYEVEIVSERRRRRRVIEHIQTVTYLRSVKGRRRRVRVSYERIRLETKLVWIKVYRVSFFKPETWQKLSDVIERIKRRYGIPDRRKIYPASYPRLFREFGVPTGNARYPKNYIQWFEKFGPPNLDDYPRAFLTWYHTPTTWWGWSKSYPPYRGLAPMVKVEVWAVVARENNDNEVEHFIWAWSRARGLEGGIDFSNVEKIAADLRADAERMIERKSDYLELREWIGFTAYPQADWYYKTMVSKTEYWDHYPFKKMPRSK